MIYVNPRATMETSFPLPWTKVATLCNCEEDTAYRAITELKRLGYLICDGAPSGCPPTQRFFLTPISRKKAGHDSRKNAANVTGKKAGIESGTLAGIHISSSFQEEKIKRKREENNSSLRSEYGLGDEKSATPKMLSREEVSTELKRLSRELNA